ncbi:hypothetical protein DRO54_10105 [Candidatus Bathyarchaeota archaeon]|nr:MAG: hypothetical protein DRO54_10105 [Candidatus Bathyarchaeota archaeon]
MAEPRRFYEEEYVHPAYPLSEEVQDLLDRWVWNLETELELVWRGYQEVAKKSPEFAPLHAAEVIKVYGALDFLMRQMRFWAPLVRKSILRRWEKSGFKNLLWEISEKLYVY